MPAKKRCQFKDTSKDQLCSSAAIRIVGRCPHCSSDFCGDHRLPEFHSCIHLNVCREEAFNKNKAKLESERTVASKMAMT